MRNAGVKIAWKEGSLGSKPIGSAEPRPSPSSTIVNSTFRRLCQGLRDYARSDAPARPDEERVVLRSIPNTRRIVQVPRAFDIEGRSFPSKMRAARIIGAISQGKLNTR